VTELLLAFNLGLLNMTNPCVLPLYPGFLAYLAGNQSALDNRRYARWLGLVTLAGVLTSMFFLGLVLSLSGIALGSALALLLPILYLLVIVMGIMLVLGMNPFGRLPLLQSPRLKNPVLASFAYGLLYGPMTMPCSGPLVIGVFAAGADTKFVLEGIAYTLLFGLGFGLPLVVIPFLAEPVRDRLMRWMIRHHTTMMRVAGVLLVLVGIFGMLSEGELIRQNLWGG
jgi:cytochrome c-type biogenesis protein